MELWIPYGETEIPIRVPDDNFYKILEPKKPASSGQLSDHIEESLSHPVNDFSFSSIVKPGNVAGILVDPIVPLSAQMQAIEIVKARLNALGVSERISLTMVTPHFASGFTGGPDILLPGASSFETIAKNRSLMVKGVSNPGDTGENIVLSDAFEAYKLAGVFYSVTLIPDGWGGIDSVFSGELEAVFREAVPRYLQVHSPRIDRKSDVVVVAAGKVLGMDLYHGVRALSNAFGAVKREGTIILVAECSKGIGDQGFLEFSRRFSEKKELVAELRHKFKLGSHVSLFLQDALEKHRIQLVSVLPDLYAKDSFKLKPSRTASSAIQQSIRVEGKEAKILIVTRGDLTIPIVQST